MRKVLYLDVETTGLNHFKHDMVRAAFIIEINGKVQEEAVFSMQAIHPDVVDLGALAVNGLTMDMVNAFHKPADAWQDMKDLLDKYIDKYDKSDRFLPAGYNTAFDLNFLSKFFKEADPAHKDSKYGIGSYIRWMPFDLMAHLRNDAFYNGSPYDNFKLTTVAQANGIHDHLAHDALSDVRATRELIKIYANRFFKLPEPASPHGTTGKQDMSKE